MCGMYGAHDAFITPFAKNTVVTATRAVRSSAGTVTAA